MAGIKFRREIGIGEVLAVVSILLAIWGGVADLRERIARLETKVDALDRRTVQPYDRTPVPQSASAERR